MTDKLVKFIEQLKNTSKISAYNEAETKQAIILPLLGYLGWDRDNPEEVKPLYRMLYLRRLKN